MEIPPYRTTTEAVDGLYQRGFTANFEFLKGELRDVQSGRVFPAEDLTIVEHHRFEGASDPDDMAIVYAVEARDGTRGAIVDAFGIYANSGLNRFLENVRLAEKR